MDFRLPNLGEGIDSATVVGVRVKPGDAVTAGQDILDVETDKAAVPVPIETAGTVAELRVKPGDKVPVGAIIAVIRPTGNEASVGRKPPEAQPTGGGRTPTEATTANVDREAAGAKSVEFKLPNLGEGIDSATVVGVRVKPGDAVTAGQDILDVETDKAAVPVPIETAGTVAELRVKPGDKVPVGAVIAVIRPAVGGRETSDTKPLVGGRASTETKPASEKPQAPTPDKRASLSPYMSSNGSRTGTKAVVPAGPATRRLARELGVPLAEVSGTARGGRVTLDDVKAYVKNRLSAAPAGCKVSDSIVDVFALPPLPDFTKFGEIERKPVANIRKKIAENLTVAWRAMPMVTQHDLADITDLEAGRKRIVDGLPKGAPKITMTVLAVKAVVAALKEFPHFNSSYDMNAGELVFKKYYHIGIAVDTERGLVVPVIRDADKKSIRDIAAEVVSLAEKARAGKLAIDEMRGGTFTITNLGGIGGTTFTPIVNYPEVAILGLSRSAMQPVVRDGQIVARLMMPMSLTYDHRVIDGADGARFTARLTQLFSDPIRLLMES